MSKILTRENWNDIAGDTPPVMSETKKQIMKDMLTNPVSRCVINPRESHSDDCGCSPNVSRHTSRLTFNPVATTGSLPAVSNELNQSHTAGYFLSEIKTNKFKMKELARKTNDAE